MYTLENCEKEWKAAGKHGTIKERILRSDAWLPYYKYISGPLKEEVCPPAPDPDSFPAWLLGRGLIEPEDRVLDIGAGFGEDSLVFAAHCRSVTALDPSPACLQVLTRRGAQRGAENIVPVLAHWENFTPTDRYDVCYSSMCPAICNTEELRRMESMSRRLCCLVAVMRGSQDRHRKAMMEELGIRPRGGMTTELIHYYNALYLMGRQPNVICRTREYAYDIPEERLLEQYPIYLGIFGVPEKRSVPFLKDYLARHGENGVLREESRIHFGWLWWTV